MIRSISETLVRAVLGAALALLPAHGAASGSSPAPGTPQFMLSADRLAALRTERETVAKTAHRLKKLRHKADEILDVPLLT